MQYVALLLLAAGGWFSAPRGIDTADTLGQMNLARAFLTFAIPPILFWAAP